MLPTITLIHLSVIPVLAAGGTVFVDRRAHKTIYEGASSPRSRRDGEAIPARGYGRPRAPVARGSIRDASDLHRRREQHDRERPGPAPPSHDLARRYDAILYVDDAHGFGVIGERDPDELRPYGTRGNSVVRHFGEDYEQIVLVAGLSKAYSSLAAFIACPPELKQLLKTAAPPYLYSGPSPVASLATVIAGLEVNEQSRRRDPGRPVGQDGLRPPLPGALGRTRRTVPGFPIIEVPLARGEDIDAVGRFLFDHGIYVTLAAYPLVPRDEVGFRIQVTAANTMAEIEQLVDVLGELANSFDLQPARRLEAPTDAEVAA